MSFGRVVISRLAWLSIVVVPFSGCTKQNPNFCNSDADCKTASSPFCDLNGEYQESGFTKHSCSATPANCPVTRCGCTANSVLGCADGSATVCGSDGMSSTVVDCALGCATDGTRCAVFDPSNGLGPALSDAAHEPDIVFPPMAHVDTDLGIVQDANNASVAVKTVLVPQTNGTTIRVLEGKSFIIDQVVVTGSHPLAIVAPGAITIRNQFDMSAKGVQAASGAQDGSGPCAGAKTTLTCNSFCTDSGPGGGGNATPGGRGGFVGAAGGATQTSFSPLAGGCPGGSVLEGTTVRYLGGGGGGALQLVSLTQVALLDHGFINLAGGGGDVYAGGGSAGTLIVEAPVVQIEGPLAGVAANGGSGGACNMKGINGSIDTTPAFGPRCSPWSAGDGGTPGRSATNGEDCSGTCSNSVVGGGGGAHGRAHFVTRDGTVTQSGAPVLSVAVTNETLSFH